MAWTPSTESKLAGASSASAGLSSAESLPAAAMITAPSARAELIGASSESSGRPSINSGGVNPWFCISWMSLLLRSTISAGSVAGSRLIPRLKL